jgi:hypothetical protein
MAYLWEAKYLVDDLYKNGFTNNEQLKQLLFYLKEISDQNPNELRNDFKIMFNDLDIGEETLSNTGVMTMMLLTKLTMSYKSTSSSEFPHRLLKINNAAINAQNDFHSRASDLLGDLYQARIDGNLEGYENLLRNSLPMIEHQIAKIANETSSEVRVQVDRFLKEQNC